MNAIRPNHGSRISPERDTSTVLTVDQGNTAIKLDLWQGAPEEEWTHVDHLAISPDETDAILAWIEAHAPQGGIYCSVGRMDVRLIETLRCLLGDRLLVLTHSVPLPIGVRYDTPSTLGADRVAAACGAHALLPGRDCVIADAGTALTVDRLTADGFFAGGTISPGLSLRLRSLHDHTSRLPLLSTADIDPADIPALGYDTRTSILSGAIRGAAAEIALALPRGEAPLLILTGGDAPLLAPIVRSLLPDSATMLALPRLMSRGLLSIYFHNEANPNDDNP
ncbi:MAG: type III pantothenate kinase [Muribaculaceae bacterium]|nr:type III pantothenate kinase [Muribaculaceae bacterium]